MTETIALQRLAGRLSVSTTDLLVFLQATLPSMTAREQLVVACRYGINCEPVAPIELRRQLGVSKSRAVAIPKHVEQKLVFAHAEWRRAQVADLRTLTLDEYITPQQAKRVQMSWVTAKVVLSRLYTHFVGAESDVRTAVVTTPTIGQVLEHSEHYLRFRVRLTERQLRLLKRLLMPDKFTFAEGYQ